MKKYLAVLLGVFFLLSFAASAFAIHAEIPSETQAVVAKGATQITIDGELRTRGWWKDNLAAGVPTSTPNAAYYDERIRLSVDAKVMPNVEGYIQFESGSDQNDLYTWGNFNQKPSGISILQSWIMYATGIGGMKVGHMPLALGNKLFFDHTKFGDDAIVLFASPMKGMEAAVLTVKFAGEGNPSPAINPLGLPAGLVTGSKTVNTDDLDGYVGLITYKMGDELTLGANYTYLNLSDFGFSHQNLGLHASGDVAGLGYKADVEIQFGSVDALNQDFRGYAGMAALNYKLDPVNLRGMVSYGSGDDNPNDGKIKTFINYLSQDQYGTLVYGYQTITACGAQYTGVCNTTTYNVGLDVAPMADVTASLDAYLLRASKVVSGSKNIGWEADAGVGYQIAKNLKYKFDIGALFAGDFWEDSGFTTDKKTTTVIRHALTLSF